MGQVGLGLVRRKTQPGVNAFARPVGDDKVKLCADRRTVQERSCLGTDAEREGRGGGRRAIRPGWPTSQTATDSPDFGASARARGWSTCQCASGMIGPMCITVSEPSNDASAPQLGSGQPRR